jgi:hypothetical protein
MPRLIVGIVIAIILVIIIVMYGSKMSGIIPRPMSGTSAPTDSGGGGGIKTYAYVKARSGINQPLQPNKTINYTDSDFLQNLYLLSQDSSISYIEIDPYTSVLRVFNQPADEVKTYIISDGYKILVRFSQSSVPPSVVGSCKYDVIPGYDFSTADFFQQQIGTPKDGESVCNKEVCGGYVVTKQGTLYLKRRIDPTDRNYHTNPNTDLYVYDCPEVLYVIDKDSSGKITTTPLDPSNPTSIIELGKPTAPSSY